MLQIATGKLFTRPPLKENILRGTLFSNMTRILGEGLVTRAGNLASIDSVRDRTPSLIFEVKEAIESDVASNIISSFGVDDYQQDFAALVTFFFGVVCSPDRDLVERLTSGRRGLATKCPPNKLVRRMFDPRVDVQADQEQAFKDFVDQLIGVPRAQYLAVMQAIRTLVTGVHRMGDDLEVAYTLMVASLESLAAKFDKHKTQWGDVNEAKRLAVEKALTKANARVAKAVKSAIVSGEHVLAKQRFKGFVQHYLPPSFFAEDALGEFAPIGKLDLADGLDTAYDLRSGYVHILRALPDAVTTDRAFSERVILLDRKTALTFQGLLRIARAVIVEFVRRQPKCEREPYPYMYEIPAIERGRLAPAGWMRPDQVGPKNARDWLEGFLELLDTQVMGSTKPSMVDMRPCLDRAASLFDHIDTPNRRTYLALMLAVRATMPEAFWATNGDAVFQKWDKLLQAPSAEALLLHCLFAVQPAWPLEVHDETLNRHLHLTSKKSGFRFPRRLDAALMLELAERYRRVRKWSRASHYIELACESYPEYSQLRELRSGAQRKTEIRWYDVLIGVVDEAGGLDPNTGGGLPQARMA